MFDFRVLFSEPEAVLSPRVCFNASGWLAGCSPLLLLCCSFPEAADPCVRLGRPELRIHLALCLFFKTRRRNLRRLQLNLNRASSSYSNPQNPSQTPMTPPPLNTSPKPEVRAQPDSQPGCALGHRATLEFAQEERWPHKVQVGRISRWWERGGEGAGKAGWDEEEAVLRLLGWVEREGGGREARG